MGVRSTFAVAACLFVALFSGAGAEETKSDLNGLWNEAKGDVGFWIGKPGQSCDKGFHVDMPFIFVGLPPEAGRKQSGELPMKSLRTCALFEQGNIVRCSKGSFSYALESGKSRYTGLYDFLLTDGRRVSGKFKAGFCKATAK